MNNFENEDWLQERIIIYLKQKGYIITKHASGKTHGVDIKAYHPKLRRYYFVEVKAEPKSTSKSKHAMRENYFVGVLGEIICRMIQKHGRYALGLPKNDSYIKKTNKIPERIRKLLKLDIFFVDKQGNVKVLKSKTKNEA